jgi:hypothetical protein
MALDLSQPADPVDPVARLVGSARVLVVLPTQGRRMLELERAIESVLSQRDEPVDVVLIVRRDAAAARDLAGRLGVPTVDDPGRGLAAAVNAGLRSASADHRYVGWLGEDDVLMPGAVATAAGALDADPGAVLAFGDCQYLSTDGEYLFTPHAGPWAQRLLAVGFDQPVLPAMLFRLDAVTAVGSLDENLTHAMDLDLLLRLRRRGRFAATGRTLAAFRWQARTVTAADRVAATAEARQVRGRHLPAALRPLAAASLPAASLLGRVIAYPVGRKVAPRAQRSAQWPAAGTSAARTEATDAEATDAEATGTEATGTEATGTEADS